jgi:CRISPR-associated protein Cas4
MNVGCENKHGFPLTRPFGHPLPGGARGKEGSAFRQTAARETADRPRPAGERVGVRGSEFNGYTTKAPSTPASSAIEEPSNDNNNQLDLIPVRALNQVSYCPRLYYLEYVEAVMPINEYVADGLFQHRRVNDPGLASRTRKEGDILRTRSVSLSSERLGITGKLDLLEEDGDAIRPVETKRSAAPKDDDGGLSFWENDAVQLCAQALLVEENQNVTVPAGIIYFVGSKARVDVPFDEALRARTLEAIALIRDLSVRDVKSRLYDVVNLDRDQVLFFPLCGRCASAIEAVGRTIDAYGARDVVIAR